MSEKLFLEQKERVRKLLRRCGWSLHVKTYYPDRAYLAAARRSIDGTWYSAYLGSAKRLAGMADADILAKLPPVA